MTSAKHWQPVLSLFVLVTLLLIAIQPASAGSRPAPAAQGQGSIPAQYGLSLRSGVTIAPARELAAMVKTSQSARDGQTINGVFYEMNDQYGNYYDLRQNLQIPRAILNPNTTGTLNRPLGPTMKPVIDDPMPGLNAAWEGLNQGANRTNFTFGFLPSDVNGDTSGNVYDNGYYVQTVNSLFAVWDYSQLNVYGSWPKTIVPPTPINALFTGFGGACEYTNDGDPIVLYDEQADRWMISQFSLPYFDFDPNPFPHPFYQCIAVSKTGNPGGLWNLYEFGGFEDMNDYPKFGIWNDGYYMTVNQFNKDTFGWEGAGIMVFNRNQMLAGKPAQWVYFDPYTFCATGSEPVCFLGGMLPADAEGTPPPPGTPGFVMQFDDDAWGYSPDQLQIWNVSVNWANPGASSMTHAVDLPVVAFDSEVCTGYSRNCIPQPGTAEKLDAISDRLMYRLQYRNFGSYSTMITNHTVDVGGDHAGIRWYELRNSGAGWSVYQQGDFAPDADHRWMGSIAMDSAGNIALGYSVSSGTTFPSIRYAGRQASDPLGTLPLTEVAIANGGGSQTSTSHRWGDYSSMSVAPDGCTFVYTNQYLRGTTPAEWYSRMGAFDFTDPALTDPCVPTNTHLSAGSQDGWILEATEASNTGGSLNGNATTLLVGDSAANQQYRSILSFNTAGLPDDAVITKVTLKLRFAGVSGTNPFTTHGPLLVDIRNGAFANNPALQLADFNAASSGPAGSVPNVLTNSWYSVDLDAAAFPFVNRTGTTQFRLRFQKDDNNDLGLDVLKLSSGNASANLRPILIVEYTIPPSP